LPLAAILNYLPMKISFLSLAISFLFSIVQGQNAPRKITYDYLALFERWKLILGSDNHFSLTTNAIFWPDTSVLLTGTFIRSDTSLHFICDTTKIKYRYLDMGHVTNKEIIGQSRAASATKQTIDFKNVMRQVYDTLKFSDNLVATYFRGDGAWSCIITLLADMTYTVSESVHGDVEHSEKGRWSIKRGVLKFIPSDKASHWLNGYGNPNSFYYTNDFLIGTKRINQEMEIHYYFVKVPIGW
jgi:hypothetical protein